MALRLQALSTALAAAAACAAPLTARAQPAAPCIPFVHTPEELALAKGAVTYCHGSRKAQVCFATDLSTGKTTAAPKPAAKPDAGPPLAVGEKDARLCKRDRSGCVTMKPKAFVDPGLGMHGEVNAAGTLVALINTSEVELFDGKTGKRLVGFSAGSESCSWVTFLPGDTLLVSNTECGGGPGTDWLMTAKGTKIAQVGGDKPVDTVGRPVVLDGNRVAFVARGGDTVVIQDAVTGKVEKRIALGPAADETNPRLAGDAKQLAVVYGGDRAGDVAAIDVATGKAVTHRAKRCPE